MAKTANTNAAEPRLPETEERVTVRIPREKRDEEDKVVWVNNDRYIIRKGVPVDVPESVAEVLEHEENMKNKIYEYESAKQLKA